MPRTALLLASLGITLGGCSTYSTAPPPPSPRPVTTTSASVELVLTSEHVAIIHAHYGRGASGRGRGRGNRGLPPGIARNLDRGKPLPPGIAKQQLPGSLLVQLPAAPTGMEYIVVAGKLLLVEAATQLVRQVLLESVFG